MSLIAAGLRYAYINRDKPWFWFQHLEYRDKEDAQAYGLACIEKYFPDYTNEQNASVWTFYSTDNDVWVVGYSFKEGMDDLYPQRTFTEDLSYVPFSLINGRVHAHRYW